MKLSLRTPGDFELKPVADMPDAGLGDLQSIMRWGTTTLLIAAVILTIVFFILGGIGWITSGGDKEKLAAARKKIVYAIIGLIITLGAFFMVNFIAGLFKVSFF